MAFYTAIDDGELRTLLMQYGLRELSSCVGASDGIENTTYLLEVDTQPLILTLFEDLSAEELPFFARMMNWLYARGLPVAHPLTDKCGQILQQLSGKPALLFPRLPGQHPRSTSVGQCRVIGDFLGRMHLSSAEYPEQRASRRGTAWMMSARERLAAQLGHHDSTLLDGQIGNAIRLRALPLPTGLIHGDLFHDNALFEGDRLCGVIDFYNACTDMLALDLAIVINDWCAQADGGIDLLKYQVIVDAYSVHRPLTALERAHWQDILQLAASRFWLSRLLSEKAPARPGVNHPHKPSVEYRQRLQYHTATVAPV